MYLLMNVQVKVLFINRLCNPNDVFINDGAEPFFTPI